MGNIFNSEGHYVAMVRGDSIYDLAGRLIYKLRGANIYKPTGELVGHLNAAGSDIRLDKSNDRLFSKTGLAVLRHP
jgi:hypothetical protein